MRQYQEDKIMIERTLGRVEELNVGERNIDAVVMTHDQLQKPHQKATTKQGKSLGISLGEGDALFPGAVLWVDDAQVVLVELIEEDVIEIRPSGNMEWARVAFNIGNMHQPAYLYDDCIRIPYDGVVYHMLLHLKVPMERKTAKLDGIRANVPAGHSHSHPHHHETPENPHHAQEETHKG